MPYFVVIVCNTVYEIFTNTSSLVDKHRTAMILILVRPTNLFDNINNPFHNISHLPVPLKLIRSTLSENVRRVRRSTYNLRGNTMVDLPKVKSTTYGLRSWRYTASKMWNSMPDETRKIKTYTVFKNNIRTLNLTGL